MPMRRLVIANQKGGCGKTTTAVNLSACLAQKGYRVILADLDPQAHATLGLGIDPYRLEESIYDVLLHPERPLEEIILGTRIPNLWIAPSNILLAGADLALVNRMGREKALQEILNGLDSRYDFILIDCAPSLSLLTVNAMTFAGKVLIPVQAHYYAMEGMKQLFHTITEVKRRLNPQLKIAGILLTMVDPRAHICQEVVQGIREYFKEKVFKTVIHVNVKLIEASSAGKPITLYDPCSIGAKDYRDLTSEVLSREEMIQSSLVSEPKEVYES